MEMLKPLYQVLNLTTMNVLLLCLMSICTQVREDTDLFIIDEVGKMEVYSSSFFPAVLKVLESNIPILASIPVPKFGRDIPAVARLRNHAGATLFTLNVSNRDAVREQIYSFLEDLLIKH
ncbi:cancer-related nucleoside-triphosphatase protein [Trifolium repens]|nr:cancer-related nucleoside-triphosphatase protein [Trifolium repens]